MGKGRIFPLVLGLWLCALPAAGQSRWPDQFWNPKPMPDDLVLPLPCNGAIALRAVATPVTSGEMTDRAALLGQVNPESDYKEYLRQTFLRGPFQRDANAPPVYYLGKYEVTADQYAVVMEPSCPAGEPTIAGAVPKGSVTWLDAMTFNARLSQWLVRNARDALPARGGLAGFVRLPTEDEWEYAARGGAAVPDAEFGDRTFPMDGGMARYVWFQGPRSAQGRVNVIGRREPNPLGLFDILGNVSEWVLDPYRLNRVGRPHGQAGGHIVRGGDYRTAETNIRTSLREEVPPFGPGGEPTASPSIGFRIALAMVVEYDDQRPNALREAFQKEIGIQEEAANDPRRLLQKLRDEAREPTMREGISRIEAALATEAQQRRDAESVTIQAQIEAAGIIGRQVVAYGLMQRVLSIIATNQSAFHETDQTVVTDLDWLAGASGGELSNALKRLAQRLRDTLPAIQRTGDVSRQAAERQPDQQRNLVILYQGIIQAIGRGREKARITDEGRVALENVRGRAGSVGLLPEMIELAIGHAVLVSQGRTPTIAQIEQDLAARAASVTAPSAPAPAPPAAAAPPSRR